MRASLGRGAVAFAGMVFAPMWVAMGAGFDLANYELAGSYALPTDLASETSAITFNWDTGTLFVIGDEGLAIVEVTTVGQVVSSMTLTHSALPPSGLGWDTEGLTYVGGGAFLIADEKSQDVFRVDYAAGGSVNLSSLDSLSLGPSVGNIGLEGVSYEPSTGLLFGVKEKDPQLVYEASNLNFAAGTVTVTNPFNPAALGLGDLAEIQVLSGVTALVGTPDASHLLILSQESREIFEVDRVTGEKYSQYHLSSSVFGTQAEGLTVDSAGNIYVAVEQFNGNGVPAFYVLSPIAVPEPTTAVLVLGALAVILGAAIRRV